MVANFILVFEIKQRKNAIIIIYCFIGKNTADAYYSSLTEEIE